MKPRLSNWNVTILGKWNIDILNPEWVVNNVIKEENIDIDLVLDGMTTNIRYNFERVTFVPKAGRVVIAARSQADEALTDVEKAAQALLRALPVTPVSAAGINFGYDELNPTAEMLRNFGIADSTKLADLGLSITATTVRRKLAFEDVSLNFMMTLRDDGSVKIGLNYHFDESDTQVLAERLKGRLLKYQDHSQSVLTEMYGLTMDENDDA